ncbi:MAG TPA: metallophosphoesterase family protein, partial [Oscillatoriaceae cyanobacterium]
MRIGLVSDRHMPRFGRQLPEPLVRGLRDAGVSLILHLGDLTAPEVVDWFEAIAPFDMVAGNNDPPELWARYGRKKVLTRDGVRLGLV